MQDKPNVPYGYCHCGCGQKTKLAPRNRHALGIVKGEPNKYVNGHARCLGPEYIVDTDTGCWIWQRARDEHGYGRATGPRPAHRVMYERLVGPIPDGFHLDHLCRNPTCVNPAHLEPVTRAENRRRGNGMKLTAQTARAIKHLLAEGTMQQKDIAARFGVSKQSVTLLKQGVTWRDV